MTRVRHALATLAWAGFMGEYKPSDDPQCYDDEIRIYRSGGIDTGVSIQCCLGGGYSVNEHEGEGEDMTVTFHTIDDSLDLAVHRAIEVCNAKANKPVASA